MSFCMTKNPTELSAFVSRTLKPPDNVSEYVVLAHFVATL
jgi:hypothetical protein